MKAMCKAHTLQKHPEEQDWNGQTNHARRLELKEEIKIGLPQIKKARNRRRNFRKQVVMAW